MALGYRLDISSADITQHFGAAAGRDVWAGGAIAPGEFAPVIVRAGREAKRLIRPMHWGYPAPGQSTEFAGVEPLRWVPTVRNLESPFWIGNLRHSELRCLIPATSFAIGKKAKRRWMRIAGGEPFAFAGIWRDLTDMPVYAIICSEPPPGIAGNSVPLILSAAAQVEWLTAEWKVAQELVQPFSADAIEAVSQP